MASVVRLQERVADMMQRGASLDRVESDVIDPCELSADQKAALWLYAWSFMEGSEQRDIATRQDALWLYAWSFMEGNEQRDMATRHLLNVTR